MALTTWQTSFAAGELSPALYARTDLAKYKVGAASLSNFFVDYRGGASNRQGTRYIDTVSGTGRPRVIPFTYSVDVTYVLLFTDLLVTVYSEGVLVTSLASPYAGTDLGALKYTQSADVVTFVHPSYAPTNFTRTSPTTFTFTPLSYGATIDAPTALTGTPGHAIYNDAVYSYVVTAVTADGKEESVPSGRVDVISDVPGHADNLYPQIKLTWTPPTQAVAYYNVYKCGPTRWINGAVPVNTVFGFLGQAAGASYTDNAITTNAPDFSHTPPTAQDPFSPGQVESVTVSSGGAGYSGIHTIALVFSGGGSDARKVLPTGYGVIDPVAATVVSVVITNFGKYMTVAPSCTDSNGSATYSVTLGQVSGTYPFSVTYFQQRRTFGGTTNFPESVVLSQPGEYNNFNTSAISQASDAITLSIASVQNNTIKSMVTAPTGLIVFSAGNAFLVTLSNGSANEPSALPQASSGANDLPPLTINSVNPNTLGTGGNLLYNTARGNTVRDVQFSFYTQSYTGTDRSVLASHLFVNHTLVEWCYSEEPNRLVLAVRDDGELLALTYVPEQEVYAWAPWSTQGKFISICSVVEGEENAVYVVVQRVVNSAYVYFLERLIQERDCCDLNFWYLDSALSYTGTPGVGNITLNGLSGNITISGLSSGDTYTMEALENYDPTRAAQASGSGFVTPTFADQLVLGFGYDEPRRKIHYPVVIEPGTTNSSGFTLWDGQGSIAPGGTIDPSVQWNLYMAEKDIDTGAVTFFNCYDATQLVPTGIGGGDGTWRRFVVLAPTSQSLAGGNFPLLCDPRSGDLWMHSQSCNLYNFRRSENFALSISPHFPVHNPEFPAIPRALNADWVYVTEDFNAFSSAWGTCGIVPATRTAEEISQDQLLMYASFDLPWADQRYYATTIDGAGNVFFITEPFNGGTLWDSSPTYALGKQVWYHNATYVSLQNGNSNHQPDISPTWWQLIDTPGFKLWKFATPTSAPWGGPIVGGGFTEVTPWGANTGPNTDINTYFLQGVLQSGRSTAFFTDSARKKLNILSWLFAYEQVPGYDDNTTQLWHTVYDTQSATWTSAMIAHGFMSSAWTPVASVGLAQWVLTGNWWEINAYKDADPYYVPPSERWYLFECWLASDVGGGNYINPRVVLVRYDFTSGGVVSVGQVVDEQGWDSAYTTYATAISSAQVIRNSLKQTAVEFGLPFDVGLFDPTTNAFYFSGQTDNNNMFHLNPAYVARIANSAQEPILKFSFAGTNPVSAGDVITLPGCGLVEITGSAGNSTTATVITPPSIGIPDDPTGALYPVASGDWEIGTPVASVSGLDHLEGKTVTALADGEVFAGLVVNGGSVTLPGNVTASNIVVGLQYESQLQTLYIDLETPTGSVQGRRKLISAVNLRLNCTRGIEVGTDFEHLVAMKDLATPSGVPQEPFTGDKYIAVRGSTNDPYGQVCIQQTNPLPVSVLGIAIEVTPGDTGR